MKEERIDRRRHRCDAIGVEQQVGRPVGVSLVGHAARKVAGPGCCCRRTRRRRSGRRRAAGCSRRGRARTSAPACSTAPDGARWSRPRVAQASRRQLEPGHPLRARELLVRETEQPVGVHGERRVLRIGDRSKDRRPAVAVVGRPRNSQRPVRAARPAEAFTPRDPDGGRVAGIDRDRQIAADALLSHRAVEEEVADRSRRAGPRHCPQRRPDRRTCRCPRQTDRRARRRRRS